MLIRFKQFRLYSFVMAVLSAFSLAACAEMTQHKPGNGGGHDRIEQDYKISFDTKGGVIVVDGEGRRVKRSVDKSTFPIRASKILSIDTYNVVHFKGSDCIAITYRGKTDTFCFTH